MCAQLRCKLGFLCRSLVGFLDRSVSRAMGCFFDCFKVRDDRHRHRAHLVSDPSCSKYRAPVVARNKLSSLFLSEENEDFSRNDSGSKSFGSPRYTKELKDEAKFLKACGTIVETPAEIRKASRKLLGSPHDDRDLEPLKYPSLPNASLETPPDPPRTPAKHLEEGRSEPGSAERTPSSCTTSEQNTQRVSALNSPDNVMTTCQNKVNQSPTRSSSESGREELDSSGKSSPNPTPRQLSDKIQTPGTVFPANLDHGTARIRSQYVYSGMNPVESESNLEGLSREVKVSVQELEMMTPIPERTVRANTHEKELVVEASLSAWLKPVATHDDDGLKFGAAHRPIRAGRSAGDRPIIGMVAAHWSEDEPVQISPKEWDGNGIPNSTNKYKEDQKVSWHATPFEERLEKALSEESIVTRKNFQGKLVAFDEEDDTAVSRVQPAIQPSSVVSY
ncbi:protein JASON-like isoform X1 [Cucurbita moschata]|uniref:Protein JASON-like isoform X1 n=1 Tax=Cucurbita moschata TaxID=3662 RepID=A0A6J1EYY4_CUCMO|nr:protein JASON-like isoform X1 [Cucurbita moschata]